MKRLSFLLIAVIALAGALWLSGCDDKDGDWDPMKWKAEQTVDSENGAYIISSEGGSVSFLCTNYTPWLSYAVADGNYEVHVHENNDVKHLVGEWFRVSVEGKRMTVSFDNNPSSERVVEIITTAGDIFYTFAFRQRAK
ncbi:MAG: hypothetical protein K5683_10435 [Prevotella sp.]|nr:hypothetical protein [Prevotella sp.]